MISRFKSGMEAIYREDDIIPVGTRRTNRIPKGTVMLMPPVRHRVYNLSLLETAFTGDAFNCVT